MTASVIVSPLHLGPSAFCDLFLKLGPSLGLWRAAEIAALRSHTYAHPVLDLGCGDGLVTSMVLNRVEIGCDPYKECLQAAKKTGIYGRLEALPVERVDVPAGSIATVICNSVIEHIGALDHVLGAISKILMPAGHFVFTVPTDSFENWLAVPVKRYRSWRNRRLVHINLWPKERWAEALGRHGLTVRTVRPYLRPALVFAWDLLDLLEQVWVARKRLLGLLWRHLSPRALSFIANAASRLDLSAEFGGGQMIVAERDNQG